MEDSIKLQFCFADLNKLNGIEWSNTVVFIKVIGFIDDIKNVTVKTCVTNEWLEFPSTKLSVNTSNNTSIWQSIITTNSMLGKGPQDMDVCAYLEKVDGTQIYDNNNGSNYMVPKGCGPYLFEGVTSFAFMEAMNMEKPKGNLMYCCRDTNVEKELKLVYSFDKWETVQEKLIPFNDKIVVSADNTIKVSNPTVNGLDFRRYEIFWEKDTKEIEFCIKKTIGDVEYWDNNNNTNYKGEIQEMPNLANLLNFDNMGDFNDFGLSDLFNFNKNNTTEESNDEINTDDLFRALNSIKDMFAAMK